MTENQNHTEVDQDAEPSMTAPEAGRPDALHALKDDESAEKPGEDEVSLGDLP